MISEVFSIGSKFGMSTRTDILFKSSQRIDAEFLTRDVVIAQKPDFKKLTIFKRLYFPNFSLFLKICSARKQVRFQSIATQKMARNNGKNPLCLGHLVSNCVHFGHCYFEDYSFKTTTRIIFLIALVDAPKPT